MATLADSFLADLEELSDNDEAAQSDKDEATDEEHGQVCSTHACPSQASLTWTGGASAASTLLDSQCLPVSDTDLVDDSNWNAVVPSHAPMLLCLADNGCDCSRFLSRG